MTRELTKALPDDLRDELVQSIRAHLADELDLPVGELKARLVLDFVVAELGPALYNQGVADAEAWIRGRLDDLEGSCHAERPRRR